MSHLSEKLQLLSLRDICLHDGLKPLGILLLILLDESLGFGVSVAVEERAVGVCDVAVTMGSDYLYELEDFAFFSGLSHQSHQLLQVLIVVVRRVDLIDLSLHVR